MEWAPQSTQQQPAPVPDHHDVHVAMHLAQHLAPYLRMPYRHCLRMFHSSGGSIAQEDNNSDNDYGYDYTTCAGNWEERCGVWRFAKRN